MDDEQALRERVTSGADIAPLRASLCHHVDRDGSRFIPVSHPPVRSLLESP